MRSIVILIEHFILTMSFKLIVKIKHKLTSLTSLIHIKPEGQRPMWQNAQYNYKYGSLYTSI
jgi:hypothetical protein